MKAGRFGVADGRPTGHMLRGVPYLITVGVPGHRPTGNADRTVARQRRIAGLGSAVGDEVVAHGQAGRGDSGRRGAPGPASPSSRRAQASAVHSNGDPVGLSGPPSASGPGYRIDQLRDRGGDRMADCIDWVLRRDRSGNARVRRRGGRRLRCGGVAGHRDRHRRRRSGDRRHPDRAGACGLPAAAAAEEFPDVDAAGGRPTAADAGSAPERRRRMRGTGSGRPARYRDRGVARLGVGKAWHELATAIPIPKATAARHDRFQWRSPWRSG